MSDHGRVERETQQQYITRLRRALGALQPGEVDDIVLEIGGHITERLAASPDPAAGLAEVLDALGDPEELAARYQTEAVLARGRTSYSPLTLLRAVQRWAMEGLAGLSIFLLGTLGYCFAVGLVVVAALKPFFPGHVGLWWNPPELFALGFVREPEPRFEVLGWWIVPIGLLAGCLLWLGTSRMLRGSLRRYRGFSPPFAS